MKRKEKKRKEEKKALTPRGKIHPKRFYRHRKAFFFLFFLLLLFSLSLRLHSKCLVPVSKSVSQSRMWRATPRHTTNRSSLLSLKPFTQLWIKAFVVVDSILSFARALTLSLTHSFRSVKRARMACEGGEPQIHDNCGWLWR